MRTPAIVAACACLMVCVPTAKDATAANVIVGDCAQINESIKVEDFSTVTIVNNCGEQKPEDSFAVSYYWLDSLSLSFLIGGYVDKYMAAVLGEKPILVRNSVHDNIKTIVDDFGERIPSNVEEGGSCFPRFSIYSPAFIGASKEGVGNSVSFCDIPPRLRQTLKIYDGEAKILWPDMKAFDTFYRSSGWPADYSASYDDWYEDGSKPDSWLAADSTEGGMRILACVISNRFLTKADFSNYWNDVTGIVARIGQDVPYGYTEGGDTKYTPPGSPSNLNAYRAIDFFTRNNWPDDFILASGQFGFSPCGDSAGYMLYAMPRDLFALVAVIRSRSPALRVTGLEYAVDSNKALRKDVSATESRTDEFELPEMAPGQTAVVPLRIELRYDLDALPTTTTAEKSTDLYNQIRGLPEETLEVDSGKFFGHAIEQDVREQGALREPAADSAEEGVDDYSSENAPPPGLERITKRIDAFPAPQPLTVTQTYVFGEALNLAFVNIGDGSYKVRKTPKYAYLSEGGFDGGSCPFLYFREADGQLSLFGRVLVGADEKERQRTEEIGLPEGATSIVISEKEPEISRIGVVEYVLSGVEKGVRIASNMNVPPGADVELQLPEPARKGSRIKITGYYETVERLFLSSLSGR